MASSGKTDDRSDASLVLRRTCAGAIGSVEAYVGDMKVEVIFKDVTYESLCDQVFLAAARKALPDVKQIHAEFHVAAGSDAKTRTGHTSTGR